jgi:flagellar motor switch protein FliG
MEVRQRIEEMKTAPPTPEEIDSVLDDFERFLRLAGDVTGSQLRVVSEDTEDTADEPLQEDGADASNVEEESHEEDAVDDVFEPTGNSVADLNRLSPFRLAAALADENPRTIAIVLDCLETVKAAETLRVLPDSVRSQAFVIFSQGPSASPGLVQRIVQTTVAKALVTDGSAVETTGSERKMVELLRALAKKTRSQMMQQIEQEDPELADRLKDLIYVFEDVLKIEDRSLQRLLAEVDSETLMTALKNADEQIVEKVLGNVTKRVRETLTEEMEYMGVVPEEKIEQARAAVARAVAKLDQEGKLVMAS